MTNIIRIGDLTRWTEVAPGQTIRFDKEKARKIRVDVRASARAVWYIERADSDGVVMDEEFLCVTPEGISLIEFSASAGGVRLTPMFGKDGHLMFQTPEYEVFDLEAPNAGESFLKIAHRRQRNPEVEYMEFLMNQNIEARLRQMDDEIARRMATIPERNANDATSASDRVHERPAPNGEKLPPKDGATSKPAPKPVNPPDDASDTEGVEPVDA